MPIPPPPKTAKRALPRRQFQRPATAAKAAPPIVIIGAGVIVRAAHLPAYEKADSRHRPKDQMEQSSHSTHLAGASPVIRSVADAVPLPPRERNFRCCRSASQLVHIFSAATR